MALDKVGIVMLNEEQRKHMEYLATLRPEQKCDCGWAKRGECFGQCYGHADKGGAIPRPKGNQIV